MFDIGAGELITIVFVLLVIFSASRMGKLGDALGKFVYSFKRASKGHDTIDVTPKHSLKGARGTEDAQLSEPRGKKPSKSS